MTASQNFPFRYETLEKIADFIQVRLDLLSKIF